MSFYNVGQGHLVHDDSDAALGNFEMALQTFVALREDEMLAPGDAQNIDMLEDIVSDLSPRSERR